MLMKFVCVNAYIIDLKFSIKWSIMDSIYFLKYPLDNIKFKSSTYVETLCAFECCELNTLAIAGRVFLLKKKSRFWRFHDPPGFQDCFPISIPLWPMLTTVCLLLLQISLRLRCAYISYPTITEYFIHRNLKQIPLTLGLWISLWHFCLNTGCNV